MNEPHSTALAKTAPQTALPAMAEGAPHEDATNPADERNKSVAQLLHASYQRASELKLKSSEDEGLAAPFTDEQVEVRPHDGLCYIPHIHISRRLSTVLGRGQWSLITRRYWFDQQASQVYAECVLTIRGCVVGESIGAQQYVPNNPKMNYSDAVEGAQSEALRRIAGKRLNCGDQVWDPGFCRGWCEKWRTETYTGGKKTYGRRTDGSTNAPPARQNATQTRSARPASVPTPADTCDAPQGQDDAPEWPEDVAARRELTVNALRVLSEDTAVRVLRSSSWLMPNEGLAEIPDDKVPETKAQLTLLCHQVQLAMDKDANAAKKVQDELAKPPAPPTAASAASAAPSGSELWDEGGIEAEIDVEFVHSKQGTKKDGSPWTRYGIKSKEGAWFNTFDDNVAAAARSLQGKRAKIRYEETAKGTNLLSIEPA